MNRYINGMKEIQAGDELKKQLIDSAQRQPAAGRIKFKKAVGLSAAACMFILLIMVGSYLLQQPGGGKEGIPSFVITAYAADGTAVEMKPNVYLPLGRYSPLMSSVPGFPINIAAEHAEEIVVTVTEGSLLLWSPHTSKVIDKGKSLRAVSGTTIYWSPLDDSTAYHAAEKSSVLVIAYNNKKELGRRSIEIQAGDDFYYTGMVKVD